METLISNSHAKQVLGIIAAALMAILGLGPSAASGPFLPDPVLEDGGNKIARSPTFFLDIELKRLAVRYANRYPKYQRGGRRVGDRFVAEQDQADFVAALEKMVIKPPSPTDALREQVACREFLLGPLELGAHLPNSFESEFRDYHLGALTYRLGDIPSAVRWFQRLLERPQTQRHYRTTWAYYMLLKCSRDPSEVAEYGSKLRAAVEAGFADSLDCYSGSLHEEAKYDRNLAAELLLQRWSHHPEETSDGSVPDPTADKSDGDLMEMASEPATRDLTSCYLMVKASDPNAGTPEDNLAACRRWCAAISSAGLDKVPGTDRLAWIAYLSGDYRLAESWLTKVPEQSGLSQWLHAKLDQRAGRYDRAVSAMRAATPDFPHRTVEEGMPTWVRYQTGNQCEAWADLGMLQLGAGQFAASLQSFLKGNYWLDAAWIAERVLTTSELRAFVDAHCPWDSKNQEIIDSIEPGNCGLDPTFYRSNYFLDSEHYVHIPLYNSYRLRWLLARRLMREGSRSVAFDYFPMRHRQHAKLLHLNLAQAAQSKRTSQDRFLNWWQAAWLARALGLELLGTEMEPDFAVFAGSYRSTTIAKVRLSGRVQQLEYVQVGDEYEQHQTTEPVLLKVTPAERRRLTSQRQPPDVRYHYRLVAADYAWKAAKYLPKGSEAQAEVLNTACYWIVASNWPASEQLAQKYWDAIERDCQATAVGKLVLQRKGPTPDLGTLSTSALQALGLR